MTQLSTLLIAALLILAPMAVHAACTPSDFSIKDFKTAVSGSGAAIRLTLSGELVNKCGSPSAAQISIEARDANGKVIQTKKGWPAGTTNIAPGEAAKFDLGRQFRFQPEMATYAATVVAVRSW